MSPLCRETSMYADQIDRRSNAGDGSGPGYMRGTRDIEQPTSTRERPHARLLRTCPSSTCCASGSQQTWACRLRLRVRNLSPHAPSISAQPSTVPPATPLPSCIGCTGVGLSSQARPPAARPAPPARPQDGLSSRAPVGRCAVPRPRRLGRWGRTALRTECRWPSWLGFRCSSAGLYAA